MKIDLSIIIPVHNAKNYIYDCLQSLIQQTYKNFEIIIIDDCSTDGSYEYVEKIMPLSNVNYKILRTSNQRALGVSYARNLGIKNASGQFISFVDADDWVDSNLYEMLMLGIVKFDFVFCQNDRISSSDKYSAETVALSPTGLSLCPKEYILTRGKVWGSILRMDIIRKNNIYFSEYLDYKEDHLFMAEYICYVNSIGQISSKSYHYRETPNSLVQGDGIKNCNRSISVFYEAVNKLQTASNPIKKGIFCKTCRLFMNAAIGDWAFTNFSNLVDYKKFKDSCKSFKYKYIIQSDLSCKEKIVEFFLHLPIMWEKHFLKFCFSIKNLR